MIGKVFNFMAGFLFIIGCGLNHVHQAAGRMHKILSNTLLYLRRMLNALENYWSGNSYLLNNQLVNK